MGRLKSLAQYEELLAEHGTVSAMARELGIARSTLREQIDGLRRMDSSNKPSKPVAESPKPQDECLALLPLLGAGGQTISEISDRLDRSPGTVQKWLDDLQSRGHNVVQRGERYCLERTTAPSESVVKAYVSGLSAKIGIVSDTHLGSKYQQLKHLKEFYHICEESGVGDIYHAGDLVAGLKHRHDIFLHEEQDQIDYAVAYYPERKNGKKTKIISGNHDLWFVQDGGVDPVKAFAREREDVEFLGEYSAYVALKEHARLYLLHPDKGAAYADSYRLQKLIESFEGGDKPHITVMGHFHRALFLNSRNVDGLLAGCFESQTDFLRRKAVQPRIGGWIVEIEFSEDNTVRKFRPEFINWTVPVQKDY